MRIDGGRTRRKTATEKRFSIADCISHVGHAPCTACAMRLPCSLCSSARMTARRTTLESTREDCSPVRKAGMFWGPTAAYSRWKILGLNLIISARVS